MSETPPEHDHDELPDHLENALGDAYWRDATQREQRLAALIDEHPDHAAVLDARIAKMRAEERAPAPAENESVSSRSPTRDSGQVKRDRAGPQPIATAFGARSLDDQRPVEQFPARVGEYEIKGPLERGGMGLVLEGWDTNLNRKVVLKTLLGFQQYIDRSRIERFELEAKMGGRLQHDGICPVYELIHHGEDAFVVMPFIDGQTLARKIEFAIRSAATGGTENPWQTFSEVQRDSRIASGRKQTEAASLFEAVSEARGTGGDLRAVLWLLERVARAVHRAHEEGIVHRDLKPENIMIRPNGDPVVLDFGLALDLTTEGSERLSREGQILGTPAYMAPEQAEGRVFDIGPRTDVYALGVILYELLTFRRPFRGENSADVIAAVLKSTPKPPRKLNRAIPRDLEAVCLRAMACLPKDRVYATAGEFAEDLRNVRTLQATKARPLSAVERTLRSIRKRPAVAVSALVIVILLFVLGANWQDRRYWGEVRTVFREALIGGVATLTAEQREKLAENTEPEDLLLLEDPTQESTHKAILERYLEGSLTRADGGELGLLLRGKIVEQAPTFRFAVPRGRGEPLHLVLSIIDGDQRVQRFPLQRSMGSQRVAEFTPAGLTLTPQDYTWTVALDPDRHTPDECEKRRWESAGLTVVPTSARRSVLAKAQSLHDGDARTKDFVEISRLLRAGFAHDASQRLDRLPEGAQRQSGFEDRWRLLRAWCLEALGDRYTSNKIRTRLLFEGAGVDKDG